MSDQDAHTHFVDLALKQLAADVTEKAFSGIDDLPITLMEMSGQVAERAKEQHELDGFTLAWLLFLAAEGAKYTVSLQRLTDDAFSANDREPSRPKDG